MDVKEAARVAKDYVTDLFADEQIKHVGLEEVVFDGAWEITIGFSRPWDQGGLLVTTVVDRSPASRSYKVLRINDETGQVESLTDRILKAS